MAATLELTPDELLTTTRAVRKRLDFDKPVPVHVVRECIEIATQAPSGSNQQGWHWVVVTDEVKRKALGEIYRRAFEIYRGMPFYAGAITTGDPARDATQQRVASSAEYLAERMGDAPVLLVPCLTGRLDNMPSMMTASQWGSLHPAIWSFCLAARARGLGTSWTSLHLMFEEEAAGILGIPFAEISQGALVPVAYTKGTDFKPGPRQDLDAIVHVDTW
ncbi:MAG TPA: nitroreductase family protein [Acidimicrobiales bacterium]|jgi:nitroreductase|nr:nitroreductase family protein [Acidimicrobiales bacterium]